MEMIGSETRWVTGLPVDRAAAATLAGHRARRPSGDARRGRAALGHALAGRRSIAVQGLAAWAAT